MGQTKIDPLSVEKLGENLAIFAINRDDLKMLLKSIPESDQNHITNIEYELQILKIISVGWGIAFYMAEGKNKEKLTLVFWGHIQEIAKNISNLTQTSVGHKIDYFNILRNRLDDYLKVMQNQSEKIKDPTHIIGPAFADICYCNDNAAVILVGTKMLTLTLGAVKEYLNAVEII
ncbi:MAG: hypothetical protein HQK72_00215 [Desulfamplus sp.]|nr:hypothetical protein [Desulfamplus sp.]